MKKKIQCFDLYKKKDLAIHFNWGRNLNELTVRGTTIISTYTLPIPRLVIFSPISIHVKCKHSHCTQKWKRETCENPLTSLTLNTTYISNAWQHANLKPFVNNHRGKRLLFNTARVSVVLLFLSKGHRCVCVHSKMPVGKMMEARIIIN